ncbi:hypothetical protein [Wenzhouxiangella sp. XN24]|uniref:hypothetical protein n=1 Tax=Wenzhouxiangella sp. XN24 TaxID=2713569 RepID=UPI0013E9B3FF|nr:hypothetical protein [Wenzhouxiangella sp. XN24]NGX17636.1 hypothetical protein [Wenzhouxiangella sp. XN24]
MKRTPLRARLVCLAPVLLLASGTAAAESFALGAKAGTTGLGVEASWAVLERVNLRAGYYTFDYGTDLEEEGVEYDGDLRLRNAALFADWHPFAGRFRITVGGIDTGNEFRGSAEDSLDIGENTYDAAVDATVGWSGFAPYLGVGFGNAVGAGHWSFSMDLGVMFTGSPDVTLNGTVNDPTLEAQFQDDLALEQERVQAELDDAKYYPVLSLGVAYRF